MICVQGALRPSTISDLGDSSSTASSISSMARLGSFPMISMASNLHLIFPHSILQSQSTPLGFSTSLFVSSSIRSILVSLTVDARHVDHAKAMFENRMLFCHASCPIGPQEYNDWTRKFGACPAPTCSADGNVNNQSKAIQSRPHWTPELFSWKGSVFTSRFRSDGKGRPCLCFPDCCRIFVLHDGE